MAAISYGDFPPGFKFRPSDEQIIELYLLPRVRGQPDLFLDVIIDDDSAANTQPWNLFRRHGLSDKFPAFFFVHTKEVRPGARPIRVCQGGGAWKSMKREGKAEKGNELVTKNGEEIRWTRHNLNFNMGSGSVGWVMHEYTILASPSLKLYQISLSGHCKKRMRSGDDYDDCLAAGEPASQRARVAADGSSSSASWTATATFDQEPSMQVLSDDAITEMVEELRDEERPNWEFHQPMVPASQEQLTMEHQWVDQQPSTEDAENAAMIAELIDAQPQPLVVPVMQVDQEEPGMSDMDLLFDGITTPSSCSVPHMEMTDTGGQDTLPWEGFVFDFS